MNTKDLKVVTDVQNRLRLAVDRPITGYLIRSIPCFGCRGKPEYILSVAEYVKTHCGQDRCRAKALLYVATHANPNSDLVQRTHEAPSLLKGNILEQSEIAKFHHVVRQLSELLGQVEFVNEVVEKRKACVGLDKETDCERLATRTVTVKGAKEHRLLCASETCCRTAVLLVTLDALNDVRIIVAA